MTYAFLFFISNPLWVGAFPQSLIAENSTENDQKGTPPDFTGDGQPGNGSAGGSRDGCPSVETQLTVLIPDTNVGRTTFEQPTLWFYVPYAPAQIKLATFSLQDASGEDIGDPVEVSLPSKSPGFVSITLPQSLAIESTDTQYHWYFELYCDANGSPVYVDGWIERVEKSTELQTQLDNEALAEDLAYTNSLIWFDAIATLATLRTQNPNDSELLQRWQTLLTATGVSLGDLPEGPFVGEVTIQ